MQERKKPLIEVRKKIMSRGIVMSKTEKNAASKILSKALADAYPRNAIAGVRLLDSSHKEGLYKAKIKVELKTLAGKEPARPTIQLQLDSKKKKFAMFKYVTKQGKTSLVPCKDPWDPPDVHIAEAFTKLVEEYSQAKARRKSTG
jgi:hypothetical protein